MGFLNRFREVFFGKKRDFEDHVIQARLGTIAYEARSPGFSCHGSMNDAYLFMEHPGRTYPPQNATVRFHLTEGGHIDYDAYQGILTFGIPVSQAEIIYAPAYIIKSKTCECISLLLDSMKTRSQSRLDIYRPKNEKSHNPSHFRTVDSNTRFSP
jgi:hypothetical protein